MPLADVMMKLTDPAGRIAYVRTGGVRTICVTDDGGVTGIAFSDQGLKDVPVYVKETPEEVMWEWGRQAERVRQQQDQENEAEQRRVAQLMAAARERGRAEVEVEEDARRGIARCTGCKCELGPKPWIGSVNPPQCHECFAKPPGRGS